MARLFNRKGGRHAYVDDYKMDESGSYTWQGDRWQFAVPEQRTPLIRLMWICHLLAAAVMIGAGCIPAPGVDHVPYILLPYALGLVGVVSSMFPAWRLSSEKDSMRGHVYDSSVPKFPFRAGLAGICALLAAAGEVLYLVRAGAEGRMAFACLFILMEVAGGLMMLAFRKKIMDTAFEKTGHH